MSADSFLATFGLIGLRLVERHGIDPQRFAQELGLGTTQVEDVASRLPSDLGDAGFRKAMALIPDPAFALRAAECWHPSHLGTLGYAWLSSSSLRTALGRLERYNRILGERGLIACDDTPRGFRIAFDTGRGDTPLGHTVADFILSLIMAMCRTNFGAPLAARAVLLRRQVPRDRRPYDAFFGCNVSFGSAGDEVILAPSDSDRQLPTSNRDLARTFDGILAEQLASLDRDNFESSCRRRLLEELTSGEPTEEALARAMAMSRRTLQRKLGELGLSYRGLLESTRYDLALRYLDDPGKSVTDITFLLGFSEQSAFTRAFKRWHGQAPTTYREGMARH
jgi:AraC-like DNA-binding protein